MANPFELFRKKQKGLLILLGIFTMISFIILPNLLKWMDETGPRGNAGKRENPVVVTSELDDINYKDAQRYAQNYNEFVVTILRLAAKAQGEGGTTIKPAANKLFNFGKSFARANISTNPVDAANPLERYKLINTRFDPESAAKTWLLARKLEKDFPISNETIWNYIMNTLGECNTAAAPGAKKNLERTSLDADIARSIIKDRYQQTDAPFLSAAKDALRLQLFWEARGMQPELEYDKQGAAYANLANIRSDFAGILPLALLNPEMPFIRQYIGDVDIRCSAPFSPIDRLESYLKENRQQKIFAVELNQEVVTETPSDSELEAFFEKWAKFPVDPNSPNPGFLDPQKQLLSYVRIPAELNLDKLTLTPAARKALLLEAIKDMEENKAKYALYRSFEREKLNAERQRRIEAQREKAKREKSRTESLDDILGPLGKPKKTTPPKSPGTELGGSIPYIPGVGTEKADTPAPKKDKAEEKAKDVKKADTPTPKKDKAEDKAKDAKKADAPTPKKDKAEEKAKDAKKADAPAPKKDKAEEKAKDAKKADAPTPKKDDAVPTLPTTMPPETTRAKKSSPFKFASYQTTSEGTGDAAEATPTLPDVPALPPSETTKNEAPEIPVVPEAPVELSGDDALSLPSSVEAAMANLGQTEKATIDEKMLNIALHRVLERRLAIEFWRFRNKWAKYLQDEREFPDAKRTMPVLGIPRILKEFGLDPEKCYVKDQLISELDLAAHPELRLLYPGNERVLDKSEKFSIRSPGERVTCRSYYFPGSQAAFYPALFSAQREQGEFIVRPSEENPDGIKHDGLYDSDKYIIWCVENDTEEKMNDKLSAKLRDFDDDAVKAMVLAEWRKRKGQEATLKKAESLVEAAAKLPTTSEGEYTLGKVLDKKEYKVISTVTAPATRSAASESPYNSRYDFDNESIRQKIFELQPGGAVAAANALNNRVYLIKLLEVTPSQKELIDGALNFSVEANIKRPLQQEYQQRETVRDAELKQINFKWTEPSTAAYQ